MYLIGFIVKAYIVVLLLRWVLTQQELTFNPIGRVVVKLTNFFAAGKPKIAIDRMTPLLITIITFLYSLFNLLSGMDFVMGLIFAYQEIISFICIFYIVCVILGALVKPTAGSFPMFFYRLGNVWVNITRKFIPIHSNLIIIPTVIFIGLIYIIAGSLLQCLMVMYQGFGQSNIAMVPLMMLLAFLSHMNQLLWYLGIIMVVRALLSWVSPDPRNMLVQLIHFITEPVLSRFRRFVPTLGMLDLSAMVAIIAIFMLNNLITIALAKLSANMGAMMTALAQINI